MKNFIINTRMAYVYFIGPNIYAYLWVTRPCSTDYKTFIETEIYTSECRRMQLREFVKKFFSEGACPPPQQNFAPTVL